MIMPPSSVSWAWAMAPSMPGTASWHSKPKTSHSQSMAAGVSR
jgi:hypothetical protein